MPELDERAGRELDERGRSTDVDERLFLSRPGDLLEESPVDPATTPLKPSRQVLFGLAVAIVYGIIQVLHLVFGLFFALVTVCAIRGISLHVLGALGKLQAGRTVLVIDNGDNQNLTRSVRNLKGVTLLPTRAVNPYHLLGHKSVILSEAAARKFSEALAK